MQYHRKGIVWIGLKVSEPLVSIRSANLFTPQGIRVWNDLNWNLFSGEIHSLIGESGSGKTTLAYSLFGLLGENWKYNFVSWNVLGHDLSYWAGRAGEELRGRSIFLVPQNPNLAFHPYRKMKDQIKDFFELGLRSSQDPKEILDLWKEMGISRPEDKWNSYANGLSGGEKQRICLSLAFLGNYRILVLDEPTTGLDANTEKWVLRAIRKKSEEGGMGVIFISHDLRIVESLASRITIMKEGSTIESFPIKDRKIEPTTEYGKELEKARRFFL